MLTRVILWEQYVIDLIHNDLTNLMKSPTACCWIASGAPVNGRVLGDGRFR